MHAPVSEKTLVEGVWFAMEQAGHLLRTAVQVFEAGDSASAVALAMFAHEELGRSRILLDIADMVHRGGTIDSRGVRDQCKDHIEKQRRGAFSVVLRLGRGEPLAAALDTRMKSQPYSLEYNAAQAQIDEATAMERTAQPRRRHSGRMAAVYLDLAADGHTWMRPAQFDRQEARERVNDAVNDYSVGRQWFDEPLLSATDPLLLPLNPKFALLRTGRPTGLILPTLTWPTMPT